jgi:hypothetical protein
MHRKRAAIDPDDALLSGGRRYKTGSRTQNGVAEVLTFV